MQQVGRLLTGGRALGPRLVQHRLGQVLGQSVQPLDLHHGLEATVHVVHLLVPRDEAFDETGGK